MCETQCFFQKSGKLEARQVSDSTALPIMPVASSMLPLNSLGVLLFQRHFTYLKWYQMIAFPFLTFIQNLKLSMLL